MFNIKSNLRNRIFLFLYNDRLLAEYFNNNNKYLLNFNGEYKGVESNYITVISRRGWQVVEFHWHWVCYDSESEKRQAAKCEAYTIPQVKGHSWRSYSLVLARFRSKWHDNPVSSIVSLNSSFLYQSVCLQQPQFDPSTILV